MHTGPDGRLQRLGLIGGQYFNSRTTAPAQVDAGRCGGERGSAAIQGERAASMDVVRQTHVGEELLVLGQGVPGDRVQCRRNLFHPVGAAGQLKRSSSPGPPTSFSHAASGSHTPASNAALWRCRTPTSPSPPSVPREVPTSGCRPPLPGRSILTAPAPRFSASVLPTGRRAPVTSLKSAGLHRCHLRTPQCRSVPGRSGAPGAALR